MMAVDDDAEIGGWRGREKSGEGLWYKERGWQLVEGEGGLWKLVKEAEIGRGGVKWCNRMEWGCGWYFTVNWRTKRWMRGFDFLLRVIDWGEWRAGVMKIGWVPGTSNIVPGWSISWWVSRLVGRWVGRLVGRSAGLWSVDFFLTIGRGNVSVPEARAVFICRGFCYVWDWESKSGSNDDDSR